MSQYTNLDIEKWARKDHFKFFSQFEEPFFGLTLQVDCTTAYQTCKANGWSFFLYYLYQSLAAANAVEAFRYRIHEDGVRVYNRIDASPTINRPDGTFGFSYMQFESDFETFLAGAQQEIDRVRATSGLEFAAANDNIIHYSSLPWLSFTSLSHARAFSFKDCVPKISFGKMTENANIRTMPVSVHVHHALADGYHVALWFEKFQELMHQV